MEEAEFARERLKIRAEMLDLGGREHFKPNEINNYISYNHDTGKLVLDGGSRFQDLFMIYFDRDISLIGVIEKIGESRLKKYLLESMTRRMKNECHDYNRDEEIYFSTRRNGRCS